MPGAGFFHRRISSVASHDHARAAALSGARNNVIDIHHHIIWRVDDGAVDRDMSIAMLERARREGVTDIVCTSHTRPGRHDLDLERYQRHLEWLQDYARGQGMDIRLHPGCEIMYTSRAGQALREGLAIPLGTGRHVLVEFMPDTPHDLLLRGLLDLEDRGWLPVLAHAERYGDLRPGDRLEELKSTTRILVQMNADTVLRAGGLLGDRWSRRMLKSGVVDVIGSDAHSANGRPCRMGDAHRVLTRMLGEDRAAALCRDTAAALLKE